MSRLPRAESNFNAEERAKHVVPKSVPSIAASSLGGHVAGRARGARRGEGRTIPSWPSSNSRQAPASSVFAALVEGEE